MNGATRVASAYPKPGPVLSSVITTNFKDFQLRRSSADGAATVAIGKRPSPTIHVLYPRVFYFPFSAF